MDNLKLGQLISDDTVQRDAIHIAVAPVRAAVRLYPGQEIGFVEPNNTEHVGPVTAPIGIVDPFLKGNVPGGVRFWMLLYPGTITSLRHEWIHPAFVGAPKQALAPIPVALVGSSRAWIEQLAGNFDLDYAGLMAVAKRYLKHDTVEVEHGSSGWQSEFYQNGAEFWRHYEIVTGTKVDSYDGVPFGCSC